MTTRPTAYVAGIYEHPTRKADDISLAQLHAEVAKGALDDAGLTKNDIDGLGSSGTGLLMPIEVGEYLGLRPTWVDEIGRAHV